MKIWKSVVEIEVYLASETEPSDSDIADAVAEEVRNNPPYGECAFEVKTIDRVASEWRDSLPYRVDADTSDATIAEILAAK